MVAQLLTLTTPKCGPVIDPTAYIYIYAGWWGDKRAKNSHFYEALRGPVVTSKTHGSAERSILRVNKRAGEEALTGPVKHG